MLLSLISNKLITLNGDGVATCLSNGLLHSLRGKSVDDNQLQWQVQGEHKAEGIFCLMLKLKAKDMRGKPIHKKEIQKDYAHIMQDGVCLRDQRSGG